MGYIKVKDMTKEQYKEYRNKAKSYYDKNKEDLLLKIAEKLIEIVRMENE